MFCIEPLFYHNYQSIKFTGKVQIPSNIALKISNDIISIYDKDTKHYDRFERAVQAY